MRPSLTDPAARLWILFVVVVVVVVLGLGGCTKKKEAGEGGTGGATPMIDLWAGVPPLTPEPDDLASTLAPKAGPERPPQVGEEIELPFPPEAPPSPGQGAGGTSEPPDGPLAVLRYGPIGEQGLVDAIRVSFNQPMVPLTTVEKLRTLEAPLEIEPRPPGKFRWMGTRTVAFFPEGRMPFSTRYTVRVPEGAASTLGTSLEQAVEWTFETPSLELVRSTPADGQAQVTLDTPIVLEFNQPVRRNTLAPEIRLDGRGKLTLDVVPESDWDALAGGNPATGMEEWQTRRIMVLRPRERLDPDRRYRIKIPGGRFGEGEVPGKPLSVTFDTYPPLRLTKVRCANDDCAATYGIQVDATTQVQDPELDRKVHVSPPVDDLSVNGGYGGISLQGKFRGDTVYTVEVDEGLRDVHGQTLPKSFSGRVKLGPLVQQLSLWASPRNPAVLESGAARKIDLRVGGLDDLEVRGRAVSPEELGKFIEHGYAWTEDWAWPPALPASSSETVLDVGASRQEIQKVPVDLTAYLSGGHDFVYLMLRSNKFKRWGYEDRLGMRQIVQVTDMSISGALDHDDGVLMVTGFASGQPLEGVDLRIYDRYGRREIWKGRTDTDGMAKPDYAERVSGDGLVVARYAGRSAYLPLDSGDLRGQWLGSYRESTYPRAFFFTDRQPYKPGETVHLSGILRKEVASPKGGVESWRTDFTADYVVTSPRGIEVAKGQVKVGPFGAFSVDIPTKEDGDTGNYRFEMTIRQLFGSNQYFSHSFAVEEFRTPEFEVKVERPESSPLLFGDSLEVDVIGRYFHGAPMMGADVSYALHRTDTDFRPPGSENDAFEFGRGGGWHRWAHWGGGFAEKLIKQESAKLDEAGLFRVQHALQKIEPMASGEAAPVDDGKPARATTFRIDATVTDQNRQAIAGSGSFVVHPALSYVGVRAEKSVLREGERANLEAVVTGLDGSRETGRKLVVELLRKQTERRAVEENGRWTWKYETEELPVGKCELVSAATPVRCGVDVSEAGTHVVRATTEDADGRENLSETELYVHGEDAVVWDDQQKRVDLVPDKRSYAPGENATVLVRSPFDRARGFLVVEREGIERLIPLNVQGGMSTVVVPVEEHMLPKVTLSALLVSGRVAVPGAPPGQDLGMPGWATGEVALEVSTDSKKVFVELEPSAEEIAPKETLTLQVRTKDAKGAPLPASLAVMVVDEGVLSLMGHQTPDPLSFFHHERYRGVGLYSLHRNLLPRDAAEEDEPQPNAGDDDKDAFGVGGLGLIGKGAGGGTGSGYGRGAGQPEAEFAEAPMEEAADMPGAPPPPASVKPSPKRAEKKRARNKGEEGRMGNASPAKLDANQAMAQEVSLRTLFATTAFFDASIETDFLGRATVEIPMPENLTTFRVMVVAVDPKRDDRFGNGETSVRVRKPIMLRPSLPRFANLGDRFEGSVMVDNQTDEDQEILVGTRGLNVQLTGEVEKTIEVKAGASREVRFDMGVDRVGKMRLQFAALSNAGRDATEVTVPVNLPATKQAFADYGMTDGSVLRKIDVPDDVLPGFGGLEVSMSSTALNGLEDAVRYLVTYRYECAEQTASRILPIFALGKILDDFPIAETHDRALREGLGVQGIARLLDRQAYDGGFGFWDQRESWPYLSTWVTLALLEGKKAGFSVDEAALNRALDYLENFAARGHETRWGRYYDWTTRAFALWLLSREERGEAYFDTIWAHRDQMPLYAHAMLMSAANRYGKSAERDEVLTALRDAAIENARTVHFAESRSEGAADGLRLLMHSDVQTDAIVLTTLLEVVPEDPLLPKVMAAIMSERDPREGGRWATTHANAWALVAASRYYEVVEKDEPDFVARIWVDADFAGEAAFSGRSMTKINQQVPMLDLIGDGKQGERELTLAKEGPGKLYYRLGFRYAPASLQLPAEDQGFVAYRHYEPLPDADGSVDATSVEQLDDGTWKVKAGANVKVTITLVVHDRANYVVVDDPLPAGFEGQNPRFVTSVGAQSLQTRTYQPRHWGHDAARGWWWPWWTFDHTQMRDDRMLLFADHLPAGVYTYSYTARATSIGEFVLPPTHAEAMYEPESFGHSASSRVVVVE